MRVYVAGEWRDPTQESHLADFLLNSVGMSHGLGCFETYRVHHGVPLFWQRHWDRLAVGAHELAIPLPLDSNALRLAVYAHIRDSALREARLKIMLWAGPPSVSGQYWSPCKDAILGVDTVALPDDTPLFPKPSMTVIPRLERWSHPAPLYKPISYMPYLLARREAERFGADDALLIDARDRILELSSANVIWLRERQLETTPVGDHSVLPGTLRAELISHRDGRFPPIEECYLSLDDLHNIDALWATNAFIGLVRVVSVLGLRDDFSVHSAYDSLFKEWYKERVNEEMNTFSSSME